MLVRSVFQTLSVYHQSIARHCSTGILLLEDLVCMYTCNVNQSRMCGIMHLLQSFQARPGLLCAVTSLECIAQHSICYSKCQTTVMISQMALPFRKFMIPSGSWVRLLPSTVLIFITGKRLVGGDSLMSANMRG